MHLTTGGATSIAEWSIGWALSVAEALGAAANVGIAS